MMRWIARGAAAPCAAAALALAAPWSGAGAARPLSWPTEPCTVSHQGVYEPDTRPQTRELHYFRVRLANNCRFARMLCHVHYRALVQAPFHAGSRTREAPAPWWEAAHVSTELEPRAHFQTARVGPVRRNGGAYELECRKSGGEY